MSLLKKARPRLYGKFSKPEPLDITAFQKTLHQQSQAQCIVPPARGAFGGVTKAERVRRKAVKEAAKAVTADVLPRESPLA